MGAGIDYGRGMTNIDHETGIRYGVINQNEVLQAWADSSEAQYPGNCPYCGNEIAESLEKLTQMKKCPQCKTKFDAWFADEIEPDVFTYEGEGYQAQQSGDDPDIFVIKSPYFTYCKFCSPCAPGAGYLMDFNDYVPVKRNNPHLENYMNKRGYIKAYCLDKSWFENEEAPYPVFSVETGELINE